MRVLVWGLGYVGTVSAACLAQLGHEVVGVEPNLTKVQLLNSGHSAIKEPGLAELINQVVSTNRLRATQDGTSLVSWADLSLICVGTPSSADRSPVLDHVRQVAMDIGRGLRQSTIYHTVVLRSTVFPGTVRSVLCPLLEEYSGKNAKHDFGLVANPEFLRETSAISDFHSPPYTVIGELDAHAGDQVELLYRQIQSPIFRIKLEEAELVKLANNAFHALKIGFANEIGRLCDPLGIDSHEVMRLVCADTKLNISTAYLKPGFAFGGSCLPKDLRSLVSNARRLGVQVPILEAVIPSNRLQVMAARLKIQALGARRVGILGLSFKPGTDDLRESPVIDLIRDLWQDGINVFVHDMDLQLNETQGSNREYLERQLPQINQILYSRLSDVLSQSEVVVVTQKRSEYASALQSVGGAIAVLDLVRLGGDSAIVPGVSRYQGISW